MSRRLTHNPFAQITEHRAVVVVSDVDHVTALTSHPQFTGIEHLAPLVVAFDFLGTDQELIVNACTIAPHAEVFILAN